VEWATDSTLLLGGATAIDFGQVLSDKLPLFIAIVVGLSALLLLLVFRSLVIPMPCARHERLSLAKAA
jgi:RND superfamily putative drug exporter